MLIFEKIRKYFEYYSEFYFLNKYRNQAVLQLDENHFYDKRVVIVGGADSVLTEENGKYIDSFDVVVRINNGVNVISKQKDFVGIRTDFLFHSFMDRGTLDSSKPNFELWEKHNVCNVVFTHNFNYGKLYPNSGEIFINKTKGKQKLIFLEQKLVTEYFKELHPFGPSTGYIAIRRILDCKPKELYITGITFMKTAHNADYRPNFNQSDNMSISKNGHDFEKEFQNFKNMFIENKCIKVDQVLKSILEKQ